MKKKRLLFYPDKNKKASPFFFWSPFAWRHLWGGTKKTAFSAAAEKAVSEVLAILEKLPKAVLARNTAFFPLCFMLMYSTICVIY
jgi:hypothetical protein